MQTNSQFNLSVTWMLALVLSGCPVGGGDDDELGDASETATSTTSGDTSTTDTSSTTDTTSTTDTDTSSTDTSSTDTSSTTDTSTDTDTSSTDTSSTDTTDTSDTSSTDTGEGETGDADCELNDVWEPNHSAMQPSMMTWQSANEYSAYRILDDAYLCPGEGDWYHFDVESLGYAEHYFFLRALVDGAGLCGAPCDQPVIPAGPEYALTIEVYRADNMQLLLTTTQDDGVLPMGGFGDGFAHTLLIHAFSPTPAAEYPYRLSVEIRNYDGEDECEC